jgi:hypothetical protein
VPLGLCCGDGFVDQMMVHLGIELGLDDGLSCRDDEPRDAPRDLVTRPRPGELDLGGRSGHEAPVLVLPALPSVLDELARAVRRLLDDRSRLAARRVETTLRTMKTSTSARPTTSRM